MIVGRSGTRSVKKAQDRVVCQDTADRNGESDSSHLAHRRRRGLGVWLDLQRSATSRPESPQLPHPQGRSAIGHKNTGRPSCSPPGPAGVGSSLAPCHHRPCARPDHQGHVSLELTVPLPAYPAVRSIRASSRTARQTAFPLAGLASGHA